jgi:hypothetical protein
MATPSWVARSSDEKRRDRQGERTFARPLNGWNSGHAAGSATRVATAMLAILLGPIGLLALLTRDPANPCELRKHPSKTGQLGECRVCRPPSLHRCSPEPRNKEIDGLPIATGSASLLRTWHRSSGVKPSPVAHVAFTEWTDGGSLRHARSSICERIRARLIRARRLRLEAVNSIARRDRSGACWSLLLFQGFDLLLNLRNPHELYLLLGFQPLNFNRGTLHDDPQVIVSGLESAEACAAVPLPSVVGASPLAGHPSMLRLPAREPPETLDPSQSTPASPRWTADDLPIAPKSVELEQRLSRLEACGGELQEQIKVNQRHLIALQAQLNHFMARTGHRSTSAFALSRDHGIPQAHRSRRFEPMSPCIEPISF